MGYNVQSSGYKTRLDNICVNFRNDSRRSGIWNHILKTIEVVDKDEGTYRHQGKTSKQNNRDLDCLLK